MKIQENDIDRDILKALAHLVKAARYARNIYMPRENGLSIEFIRSEAAKAECEAERILGVETYRQVCHLAFHSTEAS